MAPAPAPVPAPVTAPPAARQGPRPGLHTRQLRRGRLARERAYRLSSTPQRRPGRQQTRRRSRGRGGTCAGPPGAPVQRPRGARLLPANGRRAVFRCEKLCKGPRASLVEALSREALNGRKRALGNAHDSKLTSLRATDNLLVSLGGAANGRGSLARRRGARGLPAHARRGALERTSRARLHFAPAASILPARRSSPAAAERIS